MKVLNKHSALLTLLLIAAFAARLWKINQPLADWHSWRQADTASVSRYFYRQGINLFYPRFHDLSSIPSGRENPQGWRFVEFPLYNALHALFYHFSSSWLPLNFEGAGRLITALIWLGGGVALYFLLKKVEKTATALGALVFWLFNPYGLYYSRTILPGPVATSLSLAAIYFFWQFHHYLGRQRQRPKKRLVFFLAASQVLATAAVLIQPYSLFLLFPSWLIIGKRQKLLTVVLVFLFLLPFGLWRLWMQQFPEGIPANRWLFNQSGIRWRPAWWRWLFYERLAKLILGGYGLILVGAGLISKKTSSLLWSWLLGAFVFLSIFAQGNVQHDYYQITVFPVIAAFWGRGAALLWHPPKRFFQIYLARLLLLVAFFFGFSFSWYQVKGYYQINHPEIITVGKTAQKLLPQNAKVIAPYQGDTAFLYQIDRPGWPAITRPIEDLINKGATHLVTLQDDEASRYWRSKCRVIAKGESWWIIDLQLCQ